MGSNSQELGSFEPPRDNCNTCYLEASTIVANLIGNCISATSVLKDYKNLGQ